MLAYRLQPLTTVLLQTADPYRRRFSVTTCTRLPSALHNSFWNFPLNFSTTRKTKPKEYIILKVSVKIRTSIWSETSFVYILLKCTTIYTMVLCLLGRKFQTFTSTYLRLRIKAFVMRNQRFTSSSITNAWSPPITLTALTFTTCNFQSNCGLLLFYNRNSRCMYILLLYFFICL